MAITAVARVVSALQWRLTLMGSSATTTSVSRRLYCMGLKPGRGSPPGWMILAGNHPPYRSAASRDTEARVRNSRFAMAMRRDAYRPRGPPRACLACGSSMAVLGTAVPRAPALRGGPIADTRAAMRVYFVYLHPPTTTPTRAPGLQPRSCLKSSSFGFHPSECGCENNRAHAKR